MKNEFIITSRVVAFREAMGIVEDTAKGHPGIMAAWGYSGRGKSECVKQYAADTGAVYVYVRSQWSPRGLLGHICTKLNGMRPVQVDIAKEIICEELAKDRRTLLIDEADLLGIHCIEHLRDIHDLTGAPLVLVGEPALYASLHARKRIWSRVTKTVEFGPVEIEDILLLGRKACDLKITPEGGLALQKRCRGDFRPLYHDLRNLETFVRDNGLDKVSGRVVGELPLPVRSPAPEKVPA